MNIINMVLYTLIIFILFFLMEGVAWFLHKYVMHGFGWFLHEDHHRYSKGKFEKNDVFAVFFSMISFIFIYLGTINQFNVYVPIGIGIMTYGIGYFMVHDVFFHKRFNIRYKPSSKYMQRVINAHKIHHQKSQPHKGICFGFLYASKKYENNTI